VPRRQDRQRYAGPQREHHGRAAQRDTEHPDADDRAADQPGTEQQEQAAADRVHRDVGRAGGAVPDRLRQVEQPGRGCGAEDRRADPGQRPGRSHEQHGRTVGGEQQHERGTGGEAEDRERERVPEPSADRESDPAGAVRLVELPDQCERGEDGRGDGDGLGAGVLPVPGDRRDHREQQAGDETAARADQASAEHAAHAGRGRHREQRGQP
jgi:hypothetical protein